MGPPEEVLVPDGPEEKGLLRKGEVGEEVNCVEEGGRVSQERVRRQDWRIMEKEVGASGSWVDV
jgi:hypothetical protein